MREILHADLKTAQCEVNRQSDFPASGDNALLKVDDDIRAPERPFENTGRVGSAGLFRAGCVVKLADATSIGGASRVAPQARCSRDASTKNPLRILSRRHSQTVSDKVMHLVNPRIGPLCAGCDTNGAMV